MNNKIVVGVVALIVIVGGASILSSGDGTKGRFYDPSGRGRGSVPQSYSSEPVSSYPASKMEAGTVISAELLPGNDNITRVELAALIFNTFQNNDGVFVEKTTGCFSDSKLTQYKINPKENLLGENAICMMASKNIMKGYSDGTFKPFAFVSRAEATKVFAAAFDQLAPTVPPSLNGLYVDVKNSDWFYQSVAWAVNAKVADIVSSPKNNFFPTQNLSHARALYWIANVKKNVPTSKWVK